jgi:type IV secretion system protein TrbJ
MLPPLIRDLLAAGAAVLSVTVTALAPAPAYAQFGGIVYDPSNYSQNILTAARTLEQINNQIRQLQNQATSLINEARNLQSLPLTMLAPLQQQIQQTQQLLARAQGIAYDVQQIEREFGRQYKDIDLTGSQRAMVQGLVTASQSATGALQAAQAGNQLLALQAQQLADLTATVASLGRAQSLDAANAAAAKAQAREQLRRFLAPGRGYVPTTAQMFRN